MLNLISQQVDIDKIYLYAKDLSQPKYNFLMKKCKNVGIEHLNDSNTFTKCFNTIDDLYENINDYNLSRKREVLILLDDIIADIIANKKFQAIIKACVCYFSLFLKEKCVSL